MDLFFFSSRRRHTRCYRDWSSDVCSSDLKAASKGSSANQGYQGGFTLGLYKDPGDFAFTYAYESLQTDAVISAFTNSDFGQFGGTNAKANILQDVRLG